MAAKGSNRSGISWCAKGAGGRGRGRRDVPKATAREREASALGWSGRAQEHRAGAADGQRKRKHREAGAQNQQDLVETGRPRGAKLERGQGGRFRLCRAGGLGRTCPDRQRMLCGRYGFLRKGGKQAQREPVGFGQCFPNAVEDTTVHAGQGAGASGELVAGRLECG